MRTIFENCDSSAQQPSSPSNCVLVEDDAAPASILKTADRPAPVASSNATNNERHLQRARSVRFTPSTYEGSPPPPRERASSSHLKANDAPPTRAVSLSTAPRTTSSSSRQKSAHKRRAPSPSSGSCRVCDDAKLRTSRPHRSPSNRRQPTGSDHLTTTAESRASITLRQHRKSVSNGSKTTTHSKVAPCTRPSSRHRRPHGTTEAGPPASIQLDAVQDRNLAIILASQGLHGPRTITSTNSSTAHGHHSRQECCHEKCKVRHGSGRRRPAATTGNVYSYGRGGKDTARARQDGRRDREDASGIQQDAQGLMADMRRMVRELNADFARMFR